MAYKKYIKKGGKLYGPYIYESKRVDGKVVSQYHGSENKIDLKKHAWVFVSAILVVGLAYFLFNFDFNGLTGQAILNTDVDYVENQPVSGNVILSLKQGELLPASSKLILENAGQKYEYNLNDILSEETASGNFYIENTAVSGNGEGYGIEGQKTIYPSISFVLEIYSVDTATESESEPPLDTSSEISESVVENEVPLTTETTETTANTETANAADETPASPITGFFAKAFNFFLSLTPTGQVIAEGSTEINGETSFENEFVYDISGGEGVQLKSGSVSLTESSQAISDDNIQVKVEGNQVTIETSYSETDNGFGKGYVGSETKIINIDLSSLNLVLEEGELVIKIIYGNDEIVSNTLNIKAGTTEAVSLEVSNKTEINITIEIPVPANFTTETVEFNPELKVITAETVGLILTEEEKILLAQEFGEDAAVKTTRSEIFNNRLIKRYEIGNQWIEYSYDIGLNQEETEYQMSVDRMKWLKDLAYRAKVKN